MILDISRLELVTLIYNFSFKKVIEHPLIQKCIHLEGGFIDDYIWDYKFYVILTDDELLELYNLLKNNQ